MHPNHERIPVLKRLRISGVLQTLELRQNQATDDNLGRIESLYRLQQDEVERREATQLRLRLRRAAFDNGKTREDSQFHFNQGLPKAKILDLATCAFVERRENVALIGPSGVGKSRVAQALGRRACRAGVDVLFVSAHQMLLELRAARADNSDDRRLLGYTTPDLLIVDDLGLRALAHEEPMALYEIIRQRCVRGAMVVASNRSIAEWYQLFGDDLPASAALDGSLHHAHILVMEGRPFRNPESHAETLPNGSSPAV